MPLNANTSIIHLISAFKTHLIYLHKSSLTVYSYGRDIETIARWFEEVNGLAMTVSNLTHELLDQFYLQRHVTPSVRRRYWSAARAFSRWLHEESIPSPLEGINPEEDHPLSDEEVVQLWETANNRAVNRRISSPARTKTILAILLEGLTVTEMCALRVTNLVEEGLLVGESDAVPPRLVPILDGTRDIILEWLEERQEQLAKLGVSSDLLLPGSINGSVTSRAIQALLVRVSAEAQVQATPRRLRLTCVQRLRQGGLPTEAISKRLGLI
jgi:site-specific recombinase XerD